MFRKEATYVVPQLDGGRVSRLTFVLYGLTFAFVNFKSNFSKTTNHLYSFPLQYTCLAGMPDTKKIKQLPNLKILDGKLITADDIPDFDAIYPPHMCPFPPDNGR